MQTYFYMQKALNIFTINTVPALLCMEGAKQFSVCPLMMDLEDTVSLELRRK